MKILQAFARLEDREQNQWNFWNKSAIVGVVSVTIIGCPSISNAFYLKYKGGKHELLDVNAFIIELVSCLGVLHIFSHLHCLKARGENYYDL